MKRPIGLCKIRPRPSNYLAKGVALDIPAGRAPNANEILVMGAITV
jgi:hypothetical protein